MQTDLFLTLLDDHNPRNHPILAALLYIYCPAAARWWLAGADPVPVFDPVWQALIDRATGQTLSTVLKSYGLEDLGSEIRTFIQRVDACRRHTPGIPAPECANTFNGWVLDKDQLHGKSPAIQHLGGKWEHLLVYVHTWVFLIPDWKTAMRYAQMPELQPTKLSLIAPGIRKPVQWPVWQWALKSGSNVRVNLGMLMAVDPNHPNQILFSLAQAGQRQGDKPWPVQPELWALNRMDGTGRSFRSRLPDQPGIGEIIVNLAEISKNGPYSPLRALESPTRCRFCGFKAQCWIKLEKANHNTSRLSSLALGNWQR
jgi:hypothetical protein